MAISLRQMKPYPEEYHIYGNNNFYRAGPVRLRSPDVIRALEVPTTSTAGFMFGIPAEADMPLFIPHDGRLGSISTDFLTNTHIVEVAEKTHIDGRRWMKVCLQHNETREVLFLTASNYLPEEASVPALAKGWYIFKSDIVAPGKFWANVKTLLA